MSGVTDAAFYVRKEVSDESSQLSQDHRIVIALNSSHVTKTENKNRRGSLSSAKIYRRIRSRRPRTLSTATESPVNGELSTYAT
jgi:hypothetical protein